MCPRLNEFWLAIDLSWFFEVEGLPPAVIQKARDRGLGRLLCTASVTSTAGLSGREDRTVLNRDGTPSTMEHAHRFQFRTTSIAAVSIHRGVFVGAR